MTDDAELLRRYAQDGSEADFRTFVDRRLPLVYHAALRRTGGNAHQAEEICQIVFIDAARRARALADHRALLGWLHVATRNAAHNLARAEARRRVREEMAETMKQVDANTGEGARWEEIKPVVDAALDTLNESDREAVLARFFDGRSFAEIGQRLRLSENAARMRVDRALGRLRRSLEQRGVRSTAVALELALASQAGAGVPAGVATSVCSAALGVGPIAGAGWVAFLAMNKLKTVVVAVLVAGLVAPPLIELHARRVLEADIDALRAARVEAKKTNESLTQAIATTVDEPGATTSGELSRLRARAATLRARPEGVLESELHPPMNKGWATPAAAIETLQWAFNCGDTRTMARALTFDATHQAKAEALFAALPESVRQRYETPAHYLAQLWFDASKPTRAFWTERMQIVDTAVIDGPEPVQIRGWGINANGQERLLTVKVERGTEGWAIGASASAEIIDKLCGLVDPATGALRAKVPTAP